MSANNNFVMNIKPFIGIVTDVNDPEKLGRVRVVSLGHSVADQDTLTKLFDYVKENFDSTKNEEDKFPEAYWAILLSPVTSSSVSGIGTSHGIKTGATVFGFFMDGDVGQQPMVLGTLPGMDAKPVNIPLPPNPKETITPDKVGRQYVGSGNSLVIKDCFGIAKTSDYHALSRNADDINSSIIEWKSNNISKVKSAKTIHSVTKELFSFNKLSSITYGNASGLLNGLGSDLKQQIMGNAKNAAAYDLTMKLHKSVNPDRIINTALSRATSRSPVALNTMMKSIGASKCSIIKMGNQLQQAMMATVANAITSELNALLDDMFSINSIIDNVAGIISDLEHEAEFLEAEAFGILSKGIAKATDALFDIEDTIAGKFGEAMNSVTAGISEQIESAMEGIADLPYGVDALGNLTSDDPEIQKKFLDAQLNIQKAFDISNNIKLIENAVKETSKIGESIEGVGNALSDMADTKIKDYTSAIKKLGLNPNC